MKRKRDTESLNIPNSRWLAYATAGAATALGAAGPAEAEIHYSGSVHQKFEGAFPVNFDLDHDARLSFRKFFSYSFGFSVARAAVSGQFRGYGQNHILSRYVSRLSAATPASPGNFVGTSQIRLGLLGTSYGRGLWVTNHGWPHRIGFIGFRFDNGSGKQFGWVRIRVQPEDGIWFRLIILDYAWGDPGESILTGQRSSSGEMVDGVPLDGSLGLLALGGTGLHAWRTERVKTVASQP